MDRIADLWSRAFGTASDAKPPTRVVVKLPKAAVEDVARGFVHVRQWTCACGANLRIRSREPRTDGPSNYVGVHTVNTLTKFPLPASFLGHSIVTAASLNWDGLAEERGWEVNPVRCPACQLGMTLAAYKRRQA